MLRLLILPPPPLLLLLLLLVMMMMMPTQVGATVNITEARAKIRADWLDSKYKKQPVTDEEQYFFLQVLTGLYQDDVDADEDDRPQTGECVRKEYRRLTPEEARRYHNALNTLKQNGQYGLFIRHHRSADAPSAHFGVGFLPWHRVYLNMFEEALKLVCSECCLVYVDNRLECTLDIPSDSALFSPQHFGGNWGPVRDGFAANWRPEPADCDFERNGALTRWTDSDGCWSGLLFSDWEIQRYLQSQSFDELSRPYDMSDFELSHGGGHIWVGGHMSSLTCSPNDPLFWSHHGFVEYVAQRVKDTVPAARWRYPTSGWIPWGHRATDWMFPFDYRNQDGLDDDMIMVDYIYQGSPMDDPCSSDEDCGALGLLWCEGATATSTGRCRAKCRQGGRCTRDVHSSCYCDSGSPRCDFGTCECR